MKLTRTLMAAGAVLPLTIVPVLAAGADPEAGSTTSSGPSYVYDAAYDGVATSVTSIAVDGRTQVTLSISGMPASSFGTTFGAHVHVNACGPVATDAGGHYQNPATPELPLMEREIWLDVTIDDSGDAYSETWVNWTVDPSAAKSVVVHAQPTDPSSGTAGGRLFCTTAAIGTPLPTTTTSAPEESTTTTQAPAPQSAAPVSASPRFTG